MNIKRLLSLTDVGSRLVRSKPVFTHDLSR